MQRILTIISTIVTIIAIIQNVAKSNVKKYRNYLIISGVSILMLSSVSLFFMWREEKKESEWKDFRIKNMEELNEAKEKLYLASKKNASLTDSISRIKGTQEQELNDLRDSHTTQLDSLEQKLLNKSQYIQDSMKSVLKSKHDSEILNLKFEHQEAMNGLKSERDSLENKMEEISKLSTNLEVLVRGSNDSLETVLYQLSLAENRNDSLQKALDLSVNLNLKLEDTQDSLSFALSQLAKAENARDSLQRALLFVLNNKKARDYYDLGMKKEFEADNKGFLVGWRKIARTYDEAIKYYQLAKREGMGDMSDKIDKVLRKRDKVDKDDLPKQTKY